MTDNLGSGGGLVTQTGNKAKGHIAGRDVYDVHGDLIQHAPVPESKLNQLYRRLKDEAHDDPHLSDYISQLEIFTRVVKDEEVVGLDGKLNVAGRSDQLDMAMAMKERIYAQLRENLFSKTFQTIYAIIMSKIWEEFVTYIRPAIIGGSSKQEIDMLINQHVIKPIAAELDACVEYDGAAAADVRGMLYFLTGNCHLLWH